jgi:hypothetical protein
MFSAFSFWQRPSASTHSPRVHPDFPAAALEQATQEVERIHVEKKIAFGLRYRGTHGRERKDLECLNMGDEVLVYRELTSKREGPVVVYRYHCSSNLECRILNFFK